MKQKVQINQGLVHKFFKHSNFKLITIFWSLLIIIFHIEQVKSVTITPIFITTLPFIQTGQWVLSTTSPTTVNPYSYENTNTPFIDIYTSTPNIGYGINFINSNYQTTLSLTEMMIDVSVVQKLQTYALIQLNRTANSLTQIAVNYVVCDGSFWLDIRQTLVNLQSTILYTSSLAKSMAIDLPYKTKSNSSNAQIIYNTVGLDMFRQSRTFQYSLSLFSKSLNTFSLEISLGANNKLKWVRINTISYQTIANSIDPPYFLDMGIVQSFSGSFPDSSGLSITTYGTVFVGLIDMVIDDTNSVLNYNMTVTGLNYLLTTSSLTQSKMTYFWYRKQTCPDYSFLNGTLCVACHRSCLTCESEQSTSCLTCPTTRTYVSMNRTCPCITNYADVNVSLCVQLTCQPSCLTCANLNQCGTCDSNLGRVLNGTNCVCKNYTIDVYDTMGTTFCYSCHYTCLTCSLQFSQTSCLTCNLVKDRRFYRASNNTCACIEKYYAPTLTSNPVCASCHYSCATCVNGIACTQCNSTKGRILNLTTSLCSCLSNFYDDLLNEQCVSCSIKCLTCNALGCLTCDAAIKRSLTNKECLCMSGFYDDGVNALCQQCNYTCATCTSSLECSSCNSSLLRYMDISTGKKNCLCTAGTYELIGNQQCIACSPKCLTCSGPNQNNCKTCDSSKIRQLSLTNQCLCYSGYYQKISLINLQQICEKCHYTCQTCMNSLSCLTCNTIKYRIRSNMSSFCQCMKGYYDNGNQLCQKCDYKCLTCNQSGKCLTCDSNTRNVTDLTNCVCLTGYWDDGLGNVCKNCLPQCRTCTDGNGCTSCPTNKMLTITKSCVCIPHTYPPNCLSCHYSCSQCTSTANQCTKCNSTANRYLNITINSCLCYPGYFDDGSNQLCATCHYSCLSCLSYVHCDSCPTNRVMNGSFCSCVNQFYENSTNKNCLPCHYSCSTCQSFSQCTSCNPLMKRTFLLTGPNNYTLCSCSDGYYDNGMTQLCYSCDPKCLTCSAYGTCLTCNTTLNRFFVQAISDCKCLDGYFQDMTSFLCVQCHYSCQTCLDQSSCLICKAGRYLSLGPNALCLCNNETFDNPLTNFCQLCSYPCLQCAGHANFCTLCQSDRNLIVSNSSCVCKSGTFDNGTACEACHSRCSQCTNRTACTVCKMGANRNLDANNLCPCIYGYHDQNSTLVTCQKCHYSCFTCSNSQTCLTCFTSRIFVVNSTCSCPVQRFYDNGVNGACIPCAYNCLTCSGLPENCTSCSPQSNRQLVNQSCTCIQGYFDNNLQICIKCHYSCQSCSSSSSCLSCEISNKRVYEQGPYCICQVGYFDDGINSQCQKCDYKCASCVSASTQCLTCPLTRTFDPINHVCLCEQGFHDQGSVSCLACLYDCLTCQNSAQCISCPSTRTLQSDTKRCLCNDGLYNIDQQQQCITCHPLCLTCINFDNCLTCDTMNTNRYLFNDRCVCPTFGYFDNFSLANNITQCQICLYSCQSCSSLTQCSSCSIQAQRVYNVTTRLCSCISGYYDDHVNMPCIKCPFDCLTCSDSQTCITCSAQRTINILTNRCECAQSYYANGTVCEMCPLQCSSCDNLTHCTACNGQRTLLNNSCICPISQYANSTSPFCSPCQYTCQSCVSSLMCSTCNSSNHRYLSGSFCKCMIAFYDDNSSQLCQACHYSCKTCSIGTQCLTCDLLRNRVLNINTRFCQCLSGYFEDLLTKVCVKCHYSCVTCKNTSQCSTCSGLYFRSLNVTNNQCECPQIGYFDDNLQSMCQTCHFTCLTCQGNAQNCKSCQNSTNRILILNKCQCKDGYFDTGALVCQKCSYKCLTCDISSENCTSCPLTALRTISIPLCDCQVGFYDNGLDTICQVCDYRCLSCINPFTCLTCNISQNRIFNSVNQLCQCKEFFYGNGIDADCISCHYTCLSCNHPTLCLTCPSTRTYINGICQCKQKFYDDFLSLQCQPCDYSCKTCTNSSQCTQCSILHNRVYNSSTMRCSCMQGFYQSLLLNQQSQLCLKCHSSCLTCVDGSSCETCPLDVNKIINLTISSYCICVYGYYQNVTAGIALNANSKCMKCHYSCQQCQNGLFYCTMCQNTKNRYLTTQKSCLCQKGFYDDGSNELCLPCTENCLRCFGQLENQCLQCDNSTYILNNRCYADCPAYYYKYLVPLTYVKMCKLCISYCLSCPVSQTICSTCQVSHYKVTKNSTHTICIDSCPQTYFSTVQKQCIRCSSPCHNCLSQYLCINCIDGYYLSKGYCYKCHPYCKECNGSTVFDCKVCINGYYLNSGLCRKLLCTNNQYVDTIYGCVNCSYTFTNSLTCDSQQILTCQQNYLLQRNQLLNGTVKTACKSCNSMSGYHLVLVNQDNKYQCTQICGDGLAINFQCDDGNRLNGDGCSQFCVIQNNWICPDKKLCSLISQPQISIKKVNKIVNKNEVEIYLQLTIGLRLVKDNFQLFFSDPNVVFTYYLQVIDSKYLQYRIKIIYESTIQKTKLSLKVISPLIKRSKQSEKDNKKLILQQLQQNRIRSLQYSSLQVPLEITLSLQLQVQIFTYPPATFISQQTRTLFSSWIIYVFAGYQILCFFIGIWMIYKKIRLLLIVIDLFTSMRIIYIICTFGMHSVTDMMPYAAKGLQPFIYPFGKDILDQQSPFYNFNYTQLIFSSCLIQIVLILICLIVKYLNNRKENQFSQQNQSNNNNGNYYLNAVIYCFSTDLYLSCLCVFEQTNFQTYTGVYSWLVALGLVIFMLIHNFAYIMKGRSLRKTIRTTLPTRSFATSQIDIKQKGLINNNIFLEQSEFNSQGKYLSGSFNQQSQKQKDLYMNKLSQKGQIKLPQKNGCLAQLFSMNSKQFLENNKLHDLTPTIQQKQQNPFDTSSGFYHTLSNNPISTYHLPLLNNILPLLLVLISTIIRNPSYLMLRTSFILAILCGAFLFFLYDKHQSIMSNVRNIKLIVNFLFYLAVCLVVLIATVTKSSNHQQWIDFAILSIVSFLLISNIIFWAINLKYSSQYKDYLIDLKNQQILQKNRYSTQPKKKFYTSKIEKKDPQKYLTCPAQRRPCQELKSHSVSEINSLSEQKSFSNKNSRNIFQQESIIYDEFKDKTTQKVKIRAIHDMDVFLTDSFNISKQDEKIEKNNQETLQNEINFVQKKHQSSAIVKNENQAKVNPKIGNSKNVLSNLISLQANESEIQKIEKSHISSKNNESIKGKKRIQGNIEEKLLTIQNYTDEEQEVQKLNQKHQKYKNPIQSNFAKSKSMSKSKDKPIGASQRLKILQKKQPKQQKLRKNNVIQQKNKQTQVQRKLSQISDMIDSDTKNQDQKQTKLTGYSSKQKLQRIDKSQNLKSDFLQYENKINFVNKTELSKPNTIFTNEQELSEADYELQFANEINNQNYHAFQKDSNQQQINLQKIKPYKLKKSLSKKNDKYKNSTNLLNRQISQSKLSHQTRLKFQDISSIDEQPIQTNQQRGNQQQDLNVYNKILIGHQKYKNKKIDEKFIENQLKRKVSQQSYE